VCMLLLLDFSKDFDRVDHDLICAKLADQYAFSRSAVSFVRSYLSQRMQCVYDYFFEIPTGYSGPGAGFSAWTFVFFIIHK
jgi:hypothetical protein